MRNFIVDFLKALFVIFKVLVYLLKHAKEAARVQVHFVFCCLKLFNIVLLKIFIYHKSKELGYLCVHAYYANLFVVI